MEKGKHSTEGNVVLPKEIKEFSKLSILGIPLYRSYYDGYHKVEWFLFIRHKHIDYTKLLNRKFDILEARIKKMFTNPNINRSQIGDGVKQDINYIFKRQKSIDEKITEIRDNNIQDEADKYFNKYKTCRVDIKNTCKVFVNEPLEINDCSDKNLDIKYPKYLNDENSKGFVLHSHIRKLRFRMMCVSDGELKIQLRGVDFKPEGGDERLPIYIVYESCLINGVEKIPKANSVASHDKNIPITIKVNKKQIVEIELKWHPL